MASLGIDLIRRDYTGDIMITTESDDFSFSMKEYPFYHEGMTVAEWKEERQYMADHMEEVKHGKYKPLWKQKNETLTMP